MPTQTIEEEWKDLVSSPDVEGIIYGYTECGN